MAKSIVLILGVILVCHILDGVCLIRGAQVILLDVYSKIFIFLIIIFWRLGESARSKRIVFIEGSVVKLTQIEFLVTMADEMHHFHVFSALGTIVRRVIFFSSEVGNRSPVNIRSSARNWHRVLVFNWHWSHTIVRQINIRKGKRIFQVFLGKLWWILFSFFARSPQLIEALLFYLSLKFIKIWLFDLSWHIIWRLDFFVGKAHIRYISLQCLYSGNNIAKISRKLRYLIVLRSWLTLMKF